MSSSLKKRMISALVLFLVLVPIHCIINLWITCRDDWFCFSVIVCSFWTMGFILGYFIKNKTRNVRDNRKICIILTVILFIIVLIISLLLDTFYEYPFTAVLFFGTSLYYYTYCFNKN